MKRFQVNTRSRRLRRYLGIGLGRPLLGPQVCSLEITHHCNLQCSFCETHGILQETPITKRREYAGGRRKMDLETIRRLVGELAEVGTDLVELSGKGDPIVHPELTEVVRAIKDTGMACALVTNGTMAKPDLAPTLVERRLDRLSVSLNSGSREFFLKSNKRDLWDKAVGFLTDVLAERRKAGGERPWVRITHVVTKENVGDMDNMVQVCADLGVDEVSFYVMGELPETAHLQLDESECGRISESAARWGRILEDAGVVHALPVFAAELKLRTRSDRIQENPLQRKLPCYEGWMFCVIAPDGVVDPCCYCEEVELGNIHDQSFREIWYGALYREFRRKSLDIPRTGVDICKECFTSCNRAVENRRIYNRLHPMSPMPAEAGPVSVGSP
jgi:MoaA/NifB/PqqE/SkfB family radical SAM enzyme